MVEWLFRPKVQLGLLVNFAFVMFTLVSSLTDVPPGVGGCLPYASPAIPYAPLPPPAEQSIVAAVESGGRLNVFLNNDLTLVKKKGRTLVLSPSFNTSARPVEPPANVTLSFMIFSGSAKEACPDACMLVINADGSRVLERAASGTFSKGWTHEKIPDSTMKLSDGQIVETLDTETFTTQIPYSTFIEFISAKRVVLSFGPDKVELTHDQIEALRDMHRRVAPPPAEE